MNVLYKSPFKKFVKRQNRPFQLVLEDGAERIKNNPDIGALKKVIYPDSEFINLYS